MCLFGKEETMANTLTVADELFIKNLMSDITKVLCECECDCKDKECSIFERLFIANKIMHDNVSEDVEEEETPMIFDFNAFEGSSFCIDWETLPERINNGYEAKNKFYDPSKKKILSRFYYWVYTYLWGQSDDPTGEHFNGDSWNLLYNDSDTETSTLSLGEYLLGENVEYIMTNCIDECCN